MHTKHNYLKMHRKNARLNQSDIAFLMNMQDESVISRWEQGQRTPNIFILTLYHLLFDTPVHSLYAREKETFSIVIVDRMKLLIEELKKQPPSQKVRTRIAFFTEAITRLSAKTNER